MLKPVFTDSGTPREILIVSKRQVDLHDLKELRNLPEKRRDAKAKEIRMGAGLLKQKRFPRKRRCEDWVWAVVFLGAFVAFVVFGLMYLEEVDTGRNDDSDFTQKQTVDHWMQQDGMLKDKKRHRNFGKQEVLLFALQRNIIGIASTIGAMFVAFLILTAVRMYPRPVLYSLLCLVPILCMVLGVLVVLLAFRIQGLNVCMLLLPGILILMAIVYGLCVWCWSPYVDFTIEVLEMVADISHEAPKLLVISLLGPLAFICLLVLSLVAFSIVIETHDKDFTNQNKNEVVCVGFACMLLLLWGSNIIDRTCHTAYCGAFSRWYFSVEGLPLIDSLHVATTTSFGSVCFGGCVGASIKVFYQTARPLQKMAGVGNCVGSVITCIFHMIIGCTGDLIEYFDDWVYAQCAVRGTSFCVSARSSYALIACNGLPTVITDLLLDFVLLPASTLSGLVGLSVAVAGDASSLLRRPEELQSIDIASGLTGLVGGFIGAGIVLRFFSSGSKSILLCWAENPIPLHEEHEFEHLHTELTAKIRDAEMS